MNHDLQLPWHASVVVICGGIMGCSTLYHLEKSGVATGGGAGMALARCI